MFLDIPFVGLKKTFSVRRCGNFVACEQALLFGQAKRASAPRGFAARSRVLARLASLVQIGEVARRLGILHSARMKICLFEPFPAYGKVGVNQKILSRHELLLRDQNCVLYII